MEIHIVIHIVRGVYWMFHFRYFKNVYLDLTASLLLLQLVLRKVSNKISFLIFFLPSSSNLGILQQLFFWLSHSDIIWSFLLNYHLSFKKFIFLLKLTQKLFCQNIIEESLHFMSLNGFSTLLCILKELKLCGVSNSMR